MDLRDNEQQTKLYLSNNTHRAARGNVIANVPPPRPAASKKEYELEIILYYHFLAESAEIHLKNAYVSRKHPCMPYCCYN